MSYATYTHIQSFKGSVTGTVAALGTIANLDGCRAIRIFISGLGLETIGVFPSGDGTNFNAAAARNLVDDSTGAVAAAATLTNGSFLMDGPFCSLKLVKSAAADNATVRWITLS
jgi:hypothetical protein